MSNIHCEIGVEIGFLGRLPVCKSKPGSYWTAIPRKRKDDVMNQGEMTSFRGGQRIVRANRRSKMTTRRVWVEIGFLGRLPVCKSKPGSYWTAIPRKRKDDVMNQGEMTSFRGGQRIVRANRNSKRTTGRQWRHRILFVLPTAVLRRTKGRNEK